MAVVVLAIWLVGAAVTKYSLEQMAFVTPIAVVVVGATIGIVLLWVKVVTDSLRRRRRERELPRVDGVRSPSVPSPCVTSSWTIEPFDARTRALARA